MTNASLAAFRRVVTVDWPRSTEAGARAHLLKVARDGHAGIMADQAAHSGVAPDFEAYANRPGNTNLDQVALPGPIVFKYDYRRAIVDAAMAALRAASPAQTGKYRDSHTLFVNGAAVSSLPSRLAPDDEIMIANPVPYARRLEVGKTRSGRSFVLAVEDRIYERVAKRVLAPRYRSVAKIEFNYATLPGAYVAKGRLRGEYKIAATRKYNTRLGPVGSHKRRLRTPSVGAIRAPAIFIEAYR